MAARLEPTPTTQAVWRVSEMLRWPGVALVASSWVSAACFGLYILAFYGGAVTGGRLGQWNDNLPGLYDSGHRIALWAMTAHLTAGAVILLLGPAQLMAAVRRRWLRLHRWSGRIYVVTAGIAGLGGLGFICTKGTIGGLPMNIGFGLYGVLVVLAAIETYRHARGARMLEHRAWGIRLFALAIGSWLYRMDYGFWLLAAHGLGHTHGFRGPFDVVMAFFFYLPNLAVAELAIRAPQRSRGVALSLTAGMLMSVATLFVTVGTYYFLRFYWGPAIVSLLTGGPA